MREIKLYAEGVGEFLFDGRRAVVSKLDVGFPEIKPVTVETFRRTVTSSVAVGGSKLVLEGYLLDEKALECGAAGDCAASGEASLSGEAAGGANVFGVPYMKKRLSSVAAPGRAFTLTVGGRSRELYALSLEFDSKAPFCSPYAAKFTLTAFSDDPYFHGGEVCFAGVPRTDGELSFPASGEFSTGRQRNSGNVVIDNDGDETCGFVLEARCSAETDEFFLWSDREDGRAALGHVVAAGETLVIDTREGHRSVRLGDGTSLISAVNEQCAFFSAPPGRTTLTWRAYASAPPAVTVRLVPGYLNV